MFNLKKVEIEELSQFNIYALKDQVKGLHCPNFLEITFDEKYYKVDLSYTKCFFGGKRSWFVCPLCNRRAGVFYKQDDSLGCRECFGLTYHSRNLSKTLREDTIFRTLGLLIKADELQEKLKRVFYAGEITKKQRRVEELYYQVFKSGVYPSI